MRTTKLPILLLMAAAAAACGHAPGPGMRHAHPHAPRDIEGYVARLEHPERVAALQVERVIRTLALEPSDTVADLGCGPGVFSIPLARTLQAGLVFAVDVEPLQLDALRTRVSAAALSNVVPVLGGFDDPFLPERRVDLVLLVDTYHHIEAREAYFARLRRVFREGGRLAIVEWRDGDLEMGPPPEHKVSREARHAELRAAGFALAESHAFLELHDFEVWLPDPV